MNTAKCNISYEFKSNYFTVKKINGYQTFRSDSLKFTIDGLAVEAANKGININNTKKGALLCQL